VGKVVMNASVSVDGFIADAHDQPGPLFAWLLGGDVPLDDSGPASATSGRSTRSTCWRTLTSRFRVTGCFT
jgi:hypothetical protein